MNIMVDNMLAIEMGQDSTFLKRSKCIDVPYHYTMTCVEDLKVENVTPKK